MPASLSELLLELLSELLLELLLELLEVLHFLAFVAFVPFLALSLLWPAPAPADFAEGELVKAFGIEAEGVVRVWREMCSKQMVLESRKGYGFELTQWAFQALRGYKLVCKPWSVHDACFHTVGAGDLAKPLLCSKKLFGTISIGL